MSSEPRTLRVAAIQSISHTGDATGNLARAEPLVAEAKARGAQLAVLPEFLTPGYAFDRVLWREAEPRGGRTERWLAELARRHAVYLGAGYLEVEGEDFFNVFALAAPDGSIVGRVRKESLPAWEGWVFRSSEQPKTLDTPLGRIAVGICNDNHTARFFERMRNDAPDLLLMPHSAPCSVIGASIMREAVSEIGAFYAREFGIPTVLANKAAARSLTPVPGLGPVRLPLEFPGLSSISDAGGEVLARLAQHEGVIVCDVRLDPARKRRPEPVQGSYWSRPPSAIPNLLGNMFERAERQARRAYERAHQERAVAALSHAAG